MLEDKIDEIPGLRDYIDAQSSKWTMINGVILLFVGSIFTLLAEFFVLAAAKGRIENDIPIIGKIIVKPIASEIIKSIMNQTIQITLIFDITSIIILIFICTIEYLYKTNKANRKYAQKIDREKF